MNNSLRLLFTRNVKMEHTDINNSEIDEFVESSALLKS